MFYFEVVKITMNYGKPGSPNRHRYCCLQVPSYLPQHLRIKFMEKDLHLYLPANYHIVEWNIVEKMEDLPPGVTIFDPVRI